MADLTWAVITYFILCSKSTEGHTSYPCIHSNTELCEVSCSTFLRLTDLVLKICFTITEVTYCCYMSASYLVC